MRPPGTERAIFLRKLSLFFKDSGKKRHTLLNLKHQLPTIHEEVQRSERTTQDRRTDAWWDLRWKNRNQTTRPSTFPTQKLPDSEVEI